MSNATRIARRSKTWRTRKGAPRKSKDKADRFTAILEQHYRDRRAGKVED